MSRLKVVKRELREFGVIPSVTQYHIHLVAILALNYTLDLVTNSFLVSAISLCLSPRLSFYTRQSEFLRLQALGSCLDLLLFSGARARHQDP